MTEDNTIERSNWVRFPGISPRAYEHPADRGALATLRTVPGFAAVLKSVAGFWHERGGRLMVLGSAIRVDERQFPTLYRLRNECAETLDLDTKPNLFVYRDAQAHAEVVGIDEPIIMLSSGMVEALDTESLRFVIGHEVGHVLSGHAVYRTMMRVLLGMQQSLSWMAIGSIGLRAILLALHEWYRKAELSCDRAGLLCGQDPAAALRAHVMMAGGTATGEIDVPSFLKQAEEYEAVDDIRDSIHKLRYITWMTHPLAVVRAAQLQKWAASEEYRAILAGEYPRREDDTPHTTWSEDLKAAAKSYRDSWSESNDPLVKILSDVGESLGDAAGRVFSRFGGRGSEGGSDEQPRGNGGANS
ncbi:MAG TPA: M48 family metallopeptidase [Actinophytocola sp.]|uniref:M48 family metallopeptidase n=1 Tax=Actinophytocola sp. TaxID=1872138 RepID=UPI002DBFB522|nr:M48 family metallopeptidase [Actinophytocola sp.]HEU5470490.1 M48 family metallopeptidase [Actinophytocola sp.]